MSEWPKHFHGTGDDQVFELTYVNGSRDLVIGVRVREAADEAGRPVIEIGYPYSHGSALRIGRIHLETQDEIKFEVEQPQIDLLEE